MFIVDSSAKSVGGSSSWATILNFVNQVVANFANVGQSYVRFSLVVYNDVQAQVVFNLNAYQTVAQVQAAVSSAPYLQSGSNLVNGINAAINQVYSLSSTRYNAWWIAMIITDNLPTTANTQQLQTALTNLRNTVDYVYAIGINSANLVDSGVLNTVGQNYNYNTLYDLYAGYSSLTANNAQLAAQRVCFAGYAPTTNNREYSKM